MTPCGLLRDCRFPSSAAGIIIDERRKGSACGKKNPGRRVKPLGIRTVRRQNRLASTAEKDERNSLEPARETLRPGDLRLEQRGNHGGGALEFVQENPIKTIVRLVYAWRDLQQQGLHHCYNEREERYLIVTCIVITDVPEALGPLPVAVMAKASLPLYLAFAVYW
jgi:hypothetical protein